MSKDILFRPISKEAELLADPPKPAKSYFPQWYKDVPKMEPPMPNTDQIMMQPTMKSCMPFFDSFTAGYIQETWCDIVITYDKVSGPLFNYPRGPEPVRLRGQVQMNISDEFYALDFTWNVAWFPRLPKGYSALFTQPFNRFDLPFQSTSGIVDADNFYHVLGGSYPFLLKKGFEGIIPKGTPMYQIVPIKRDGWHSSKVEYDEVETLKRSAQMSSYFSGAYRKLFHVKKSFK